MGEHHRPGGVAIAVRSLKACWSWMLTEALIAESMFTRLRVSFAGEAQRTATDDKIERMLTSAKRSKRDHVLLTVLVDTGCRRRELANVEMADGLITFRISKTRGRTVLLSDRAIVALGRWLRERGVGSGSVWSVDDPVLIDQRSRAAGQRWHAACSRVEAGVRLPMAGPRWFRARAAAQGS